MVSCIDCSMYKPNLGKQIHLQRRKTRVLRREDVFSAWVRPEKRRGVTQYLWFLVNIRVRLLCLLAMTLNEGVWTCHQDWKPSDSWQLLIVFLIVVAVLIYTAESEAEDWRLVPVSPLSPHPAGFFTPIISRRRIQIMKVLSEKTILKKSNIINVWIIVLIIFLF